MISDAEEMWVKISEYEEPFFRAGVLIKFKTLDTAGDEYKYAMGVRIDHDEDISFVGFDGRTWGYGRCTVPKDARFQSQKYTVSREWLINNFMTIARPENPEDIWVCRKAMNLMRACASIS